MGIHKIIDITREITKNEKVQILRSIEVDGIIHFLCHSKYYENI